MADSDTLQALKKLLALYGYELTEKNGLLTLKGPAPKAGADRPVAGQFADDNALYDFLEGNLGVFLFQDNAGQLWVKDNQGWRWYSPERGTWLNQPEASVPDTIQEEWQSLQPEGTGGEYSSEVAAQTAIDADPEKAGMKPKWNSATGTWRIAPAPPGIAFWGPWANEGEFQAALAANPDLQKWLDAGYSRQPDFNTGKLELRPPEEPATQASLEQQLAQAVQEAMAAAPDSPEANAAWDRAEVLQAQIDRVRRGAAEPVDVQAQAKQEALDLLSKANQWLPIWIMSQGGPDKVTPQAWQQLQDQLFGPILGTQAQAKGAGFVPGFGTQAQRQAGVRQGIPLGQVESQVPTGFFGAGPEVGGKLPVMLPGGIPETLAPEPGATATTLPPSPGVGGFPGGLGLPGTGKQPTFEDAAAQFNQQLITAMNSGQITEAQRNQAWQDFLKQWGKYPGASMGTTAGGLPVTFGTGVSPTGQQNYQGGWVDVPGVGLVPEGAAKSYEAQQKELGALTPGSPYYGAINLDPAFLKQGTPIWDLPYVQDVLGRQFKVSGPEVAPSFRGPGQGGQSFTFLGGGPEQAARESQFAGTQDWFRSLLGQPTTAQKWESKKKKTFAAPFLPWSGGMRFG